MGPIGHFGVSLCLSFKSIDLHEIDAGADPGFLLGGGASLRNDVTIQDFS